MNGWRRSAGSDSGTTLAELMIVLALLGFILAAAYGLLSVVDKGMSVNAPIAAAGTTFSEPAEFMSRIIMQATAIGAFGQIRTPTGTSVTLPSPIPANPSAYAMAVRTDRVPYDGSWELNYFHVDASAPTVLQWDQWGYTNSNVQVGSKRMTWKMSQSIASASAVPLFTYYDSNLAPIPSSETTAIMTSVRSVQVRLVPEMNGTPVEDSRWINWRN